MILSSSVVFEPTEDELRSTADQLNASGDVAAIFDNSTSSACRARVRRRCEERGITYLTEGANKGVAGGLNGLVSYGREAGVQWLLYFDQDSILGEGYWEALPSSLALVCSRPDVALVGSRISSGARRERVRGQRFDEARFVIASGTLMRVPVVSGLGGFDESFFVDLVDHDMCFRVRAAGLRVLRDNHRVLIHAAGRDMRVLLPSRGLFVTRHPIWRRELMWCNSIRLVRRYGCVFPLDCLRHLAVRALETLLGAIVYGEVGYVTSAARGLAAGVRKNA